MKPGARRREWFGPSCAEIDGQAVRYFFNGLPPGRREVIRRHLLGCPRCRRKLAVFHRAWAHGGEEANPA